MNIPYLIKLSASILISLVTSYSYGQILKIEFDKTPTSGVFFNNDNPRTEITSWRPIDKADNSLDDFSNILEGTVAADLPGSFHVDNTGTSFDGLEVFLNASNSTRWTTKGLADGTSGINSADEFISISFSRAVTLSLLDLADFNGGDTTLITSTSRPDQEIIGSTTTNGVINLDLNMAAGDTIDVRWKDISVSNNFWVQSFTLTAVPEPSTVVGLIGGFLFVTIITIKRKRHCSKFDVE